MSWHATNSEQFHLQAISTVNDADPVPAELVIEIDLWIGGVAPGGSWNRSTVQVTVVELLDNTVACTPSMYTEGSTGPKPLPVSVMMSVGLNVNGDTVVICGTGWDDKVQ